MKQLEVFFPDSSKNGSELYISIPGKILTFFALQVKQMQTELPSKLGKGAKEETA